MAVVTTKSTQITNRDATPRVLTSGYLAAAEVKHKRDIVTTVNGDSATSKYIYFTIPSNAVLISLRKNHPDIGTTTAGDIGLYQTTANGGAVVDADFFTAASVFNAGAVSKTEVGFGNVLTVANMNKRIWEALGLSADPKIDYDVVVTLTGAADAAAALQLEMDYAV